MPLIVITGYPCSYKSKRAGELKKYFEEKGKEVHIINESEEITKAGFDRNTYYNDSRKEKQVRDILKSHVTRLISPRNLVIYDGSNYIKGYRYELYCITKANHSTQCTLYTIVNKDVAAKLNDTREENEKYSTETFDGLLMRYEEPDGKNRWDAPLFIVPEDAELDFDSINACLFEKQAPAPNLSTQNAPLSSTNFLYDMNKIVKGITSGLIGNVSKGCKETIQVPNYSDLEINLKNATIPKLLSLSRQYINYSKMNTPELENVPALYVQYLQTNLGHV